jgi:hypothetical protein
MSRRLSLLLVIAGMLLGTSWGIQGPSSRADDESKSAENKAGKERPRVRRAVLHAFMRTKLAASQKVLEGLAVEDFDLITKGAGELIVVAGAAEFMVSDDAAYVEHADDFRRILRKLAVAAKEKRLDGATLAYVDMTMSCVECHKQVRTLPLDKAKE